MGCCRSFCYEQSPSFLFPITGELNRGLTRAIIVLTLDDALDVFSFFGGKKQANRASILNRARQSCNDRTPSPTLERVVRHSSRLA
jgi:hypothetical protein